MQTLLSRQPGGPDRATQLVRLLLLVFAFTLPLYFDLAVPEVSGDIRWAATSFFAGLTCLILLGGAMRKGGPLQLSLRGPVILWCAGALALWAGVSLLDALNPYRGIILIKALVAQLLLLVAVWWVTPPRAAETAAFANGGGFAKALIWALAAPISLTALIGFVQFHGYTQSSFEEALWSSPYIIFAPVLSVLGWLTSWLHGLVPGWPAALGLADQLTGFFLQSAIPGGTFANKNLAGSYTAMMIPLMLYLWLSSKRWWSQALATGLLTMALVFLVYARARASWLALFGALLVLIVLALTVPSLRHAIRARLRWGHVAWLLLPLLIVARHAGDVSPIQGSHGIDRTPAQQIAALGSGAGGWNEYGGRLAYNLNSLVITKDYWFNGVGLGSFFTIYPAYHDALVPTPTNSYNVLARPQRTHTDVMQAFTELGVPGGVFYVGLFALAIGLGLRLAGPRAGALGGKLIGMGLLGGLAALTLFLWLTGLLRLPGVWQWLFLGGLLGVVGYLAWRWVHAAQAVQREQVAPLDEQQLAGWFGSMGLLTISLNAFLDFPMQLPTAPAAALLLAGLFLGLHQHLDPGGWQLGPRRTFTLPRLPTLAALMALLLGAWGWALYDAAKFREGNMILKGAMTRIFAGVVDDVTYDLITAAQAAYPLDPRIHENLGVVYANYRGTRELPLSERIAKLEWVLAGDPWGANHLVNLAGQYLALVEQARVTGDTATMARGLARLEELNRRLMRTAGFSHLSWSISGLTEIMKGRPARAIPLLQRALTIDPTYAPARNGLRVAQAQANLEPVVIRDDALAPRRLPAATGSASAPAVFP